MSLCPEHEMRAAMTDDEFWEHVLQPDAYLYPEPDGPDLDVEISRLPCPECGATGACAWDADGRPLIHATEDDDS